MSDDRPAAAISEPVLRCAHVALREETDRNDVDLSVAPQALAAAEELLDYPRATWAPPVGVWQQTVTAVALAALRVEGALQTTRGRALDAVLQAALEIAQEAR